MALSPSRRAIRLVSEVTGLEEDLSRFLVEELIASHLPNVEEDEEVMASVLGEHLVRSVAIMSRSRNPLMM